MPVAAAAAEHFKEHLPERIFVLLLALAAREELAPEEVPAILQLQIPDQAAAAAETTLEVERAAVMGEPGVLLSKSSFSRNFSIIGLFLAAIIFRFGGSYYEGEWLGFGIAFVAVLIFGISKRIGWFAATTIAYFLCNALWILFYAENRYAGISPTDLLAIKYYAAEAAFKLLLITTPLLLINFNVTKIRYAGRWLVLFFIMLSVAKTFLDFITVGCGDTNSCGGVMMNPSLNSGMLVAGLPIAVDMLPVMMGLPLVALVWMAIVAGKSGVGLAVFSLFVSLYALKRWWTLLLIPVAFIARQFYGTEKILLSLGDRDVMWRFFMEKWAHNKANWLFGTGFGTYDFFSFNLQQHFGMRIQYWWKWMHCDLLELIFETGFVGGALLIAVFVALLFGLYKKKFFSEFKAAILFGIGALVNYPLHIGLTCAFAVWLAFLGLSPKYQQPKLRKYFDE